MDTIPFEIIKPINPDIPPVQLCGSPNKPLSANTLEVYIIPPNITSPQITVSHPRFLISFAIAFFSSIEIDAISVIISSEDAFSRPSNSTTLIPRAAARSSIIAISGKCVPVSHLLTVLSETWSFSARTFCVKPRSFLIAEILLPISFLSICIPSFPLYCINSQ